MRGIRNENLTVEDKWTLQYKKEMDRETYKVFTHIYERFFSMVDFAITINSRLNRVMSCLAIYPLKEINFKLMMKICNENKEKNYFLKYCLLIFVCLDEMNLTRGKDKGKGIVNKKNYIGYFNSSKRFTTDDYLKITYNSVIYHKYNNLNRSACFLVPYINEETNNLLQEHLDTFSDKNIQNKVSYRYEKFIWILFDNYTAKKITLNNFNDDTFEYHLNIIRSQTSNETIICKKASGRIVKEFNHFVHNLILLYTFIQEKQGERCKDNFKKYTADIFKYNYLPELLSDNYEIVNYNLFMKPPMDCDKAILNFSEFLKNHSKSESDRCINVYLSEIKNSILKNYIWEFLWLDKKVSVSTKQKLIRNIIVFLTFMNKYFNENTVIFDFDIDKIVDFRNYVTSELGLKTNDMFQCIKHYLMFLEDKENVSVNKIVYSVITYDTEKKKARKSYYTDEEMKAISDKLNSYIDTSKDVHERIRYLICSNLLYLMSNTSLRISTILSLKRDCLIKTLNRKGKEEFKIKYSSKTSKQFDLEEENITLDTYNVLKESMDITVQYASKMTGVEKDYIFVNLRDAGKQVAVFRSEYFREKIKKACNELGIEYKGIAGIRNKFMNEATDYVNKSGYTDKELERLTRHTSKVHYKNYASPSEEFLSLMYEVDISKASLKVKNNVREEIELNNETLVAEESGHCTNDNCDNNGNCLICPCFVTSLSFMDTFKKHIETIDRKILNEDIIHEKEHLVHKKEIYVAYYDALLQLKEKLEKEKTSKKKTNEITINKKTINKNTLKNAMNKRKGFALNVRG